MSNKIKGKENKRKKKIIICVATMCILILLIPNLYFFKYRTDHEKVTANNNCSDAIIVASYNIRCQTILDIGKKNWFYRAGLVCANIKSINPDIIGFQEVTSAQYRYLKEKMEGFGSVIQYRNNVPWSEGCPIFFNLNKYELLQSGTFWLSETPERISKSWGAANYRVCTYIILQDKLTHFNMAVFNTHLDHQSEEAKIKGIEVIQEKIRLFKDMPIILMGDFNSTEYTDTYRSITKKFSDTKYSAIKKRIGCTYQDWGKECGSSPIDYIMISPESFNVEQYYVWEQLYDETYPSDHFPVCVELKKISNK